MDRWPFRQRGKAPTARSIPAWGEAPGKGASGMRGLKARSTMTNQSREIVAFMPNHRAGFQPSHFLFCRFLGLRPRLGSNAPLALKSNSTIAQTWSID